jgi:hypothetical protein
MTGSTNEVSIIIALIAVTLFTLVVVSVDTLGIVVLVGLLAALGVAVGRKHRT